MHTVMATALSQQLQGISQAWGASQPGSRGRPSLLFTPQQAADTDIHSIYSIGRQGAWVLEAVWIVVPELGVELQSACHYDTDSVACPSLVDYLVRASSAIRNLASCRHRY